MEGNFDVDAWLENEEASIQNLSFDDVDSSELAQNGMSPPFVPADLLSPILSPQRSSSPAVQRLVFSPTFESRNSDSERSSFEFPQGGFGDIVFQDINDADDEFKEDDVLDLDKTADISTNLDVAEAQLILLTPIPDRLPPEELNISFGNASPRKALKDIEHQEGDVIYGGRTRGDIDINSEALDDSLMSDDLSRQLDDRLEDSHNELADYHRRRSISADEERRKIIQDSKMRLHSPTTPQMKMEEPDFALGSPQTNGSGTLNQNQAAEKEEKVEKKGEKKEEKEEKREEEVKAEENGDNTSMNIILSRSSPNIRGNFVPPTTGSDPVKRGSLTLPRNRAPSANTSTSNIIVPPGLTLPRSRASSGQDKATQPLPTPSFLTLPNRSDSPSTSSQATPEKSRGSADSNPETPRSRSNSVEKEKKKVVPRLSLPTPTRSTSGLKGPATKIALPKPKTTPRDSTSDDSGSGTSTPKEEKKIATPRSAVPRASTGSMPDRKVETTQLSSPRKTSLGTPTKTSLGTPTKTSLGTPTKTSKPTTRMSLGSTLKEPATSTATDKKVALSKTSIAPVKVAAKSVTSVKTSPVVNKVPVKETTEATKGETVGTEVEPAATNIRAPPRIAAQASTLSAPASKLSAPTSKLAPPTTVTNGAAAPSKLAAPPPRKLALPSSRTAVKKSE
ncbi:hypothetical protein PROFUN_02083 [Planoprotostelium fungivorum]|uniref:Uncharacterized protein n=1 Tax=Planoprotostelium fungivorum TaxID=1890364 RepID=A0A2P6NBC5_9EUKA|nr:hypothetical protein PROFUN_02083 [Planoprotostelium fungivorum]